MIAKLVRLTTAALVVTEEQKIRFATAIDRVAGDVDLLVSIAAIVTEDVPAVFAKFKEQLATGLLTEVTVTGHQLKGMLSTFETRGPVVLLQEVISSARKGNQQEADDTFHRCAVGISSLIEEIKQLGAAHS